MRPALEARRSETLDVGAEPAGEAHDGLGGGFSKRILRSVSSARRAQADQQDTVV